MFNINKSMKMLVFLKYFTWKGIVSPLIIFMILSMMIFPLPSLILDFCFTFNIIISIIILLESMFIKNILEFSVFPTILLLSTLFRLSLNVASARIILLKGHTGSFAAGYIVESFGRFLVGGDFSIGVIIFIILVIINFMVITKGSSRVAEVGARFALDGMPGKQMSIDADLNAGFIGGDKAKLLRRIVMEESDFYGSMDGASKFIRGDAIAGILIMIINILGGLIIGLSQHNMKLSEASKIYTLLTIGDGLVAQIPALLISTAAGFIVTKVNNNENISEQIINQVLYHPKVILLTGVLLSIFGVIPGMPNLIFLSFGFMLIIIAYVLNILKKKSVYTSNKLNNFKKRKYDQLNHLSWKDIKLEDYMRIEIGISLYKMINDKDPKNLFIQISKIRKNIVKDMGFLPPVINVKCNLKIPKYNYKIFIKGVEYSSGIIFLNQLMAISTFQTNEILSGFRVHEPLFGKYVYWIDNNLKEEAIKKKYVLIHDKLVIAKHINNLMFSNLEKFFGMQETQQLLDYISFNTPKLVEELFPNIINLNGLYKILNSLLLEKIPIIDMRTILETLIEYAPVYKNTDELVGLVRIALSDLITQKFLGSKSDVHVLGLDKKLENIILSVVHAQSDDIEPIISDVFLKNTKKAIDYQISIKAPLVLLVKHNIRFFVFRFLKKYFSDLIVLSTLEISNTKKVFIKHLITY